MKKYIILLASQYTNKEARGGDLEYKTAGANFSQFILCVYIMMVQLWSMKEVRMEPVRSLKGDGVIPKAN